jgi:hypothetical protein
LEVAVVIERIMANEIERISADEALSEVEKLAAAFGLVTESIIEQNGRNLELARAMGDEETAVKEQIKSGVMKTAREAFEFCYIKVTGTRKGIWHEQDES